MADKPTVHADRYDFIKTWCGIREPWAEGSEMVNDDALDEVTCEACLDAMAALGAEASWRKVSLAIEARGGGTMSHDPGDEHRDEFPLNYGDGQSATVETMTAHVESFLGRYFGKRDDETLGDAMHRVALESNGACAAMQKRSE